MGLQVLLRELARHNLGLCVVSTRAYARLHLAMGDTARARESLATARAMVTGMGYHRRDAEVQELEEQLSRS